MFLAFSEKVCLVKVALQDELVAKLVLKLKKNLKIKKKTTLSPVFRTLNRIKDLHKHTRKKKRKFLAAVGFEPTPSK